MIPMHFSIQNMYVPEGTTDLVVPFPYTRREFIHVYKGHTVQKSHEVPEGTVELPFTWVTESLIRLHEPIQGEVQITRRTSYFDTWEYPSYTNLELQ